MCWKVIVLPLLVNPPSSAVSTEPTISYKNLTYGFFYGALSLSMWSKYGRCVLCPLCREGQRLTSACGITHADHTRLGWADSLQRGVTQWWDCTPQSTAVTRMWTRLLEDDRWWFNMATLSAPWSVRGWTGPTGQSSSEGLFGTEGTFSSAWLDCVRQREQRLLQERGRRRPHKHRMMDKQKGKDEAAFTSLHYRIEAL